MLEKNQHVMKNCLTSNRAVRTYFLTPHASRLTPHACFNSAQHKSLIPAVNIFSGVNLILALMESHTTTGTQSGFFYISADPFPA